MYPFYVSDDIALLDEMNEINEFANKLFIEVANSRAKPSSLFHYTNAAGFHGIINDCCLRAAHIAYMSDWNEYVFASNTLREVAEQHEPRTETQEFFIHQLVPVLNEQNFSWNDYPPIFLSCLSMAKNDLSQWRTYAGGEGGYSIEFDTVLMGTKCWENGVYLLPVIYDEDEQKKYANKVLLGSMAIFEKHAEKMKDNDLENYTKKWYFTWRTCICMLGPAFKHNGFRKEEE